MADKTTALDSIIGEGCVIDGNYSFPNNSTIHGEVRGSIRSKGQLMVGPTALIKGDVKVSQVFIHGTIEGTISDCDYLEIFKGGHVVGDINLNTNALVSHEGAVVNGQIMMSGSKMDK